MENQNVTTETPYANPAVPPVAPKKKGNNVVIGLVVAIIALVLALGSLVGVAAYNMLANSPEARLAKGFSKWNATEGVNKNSVSEILGWEEINEAMLHGATHKDLSLNLTFPALDIPTIGLDMEDACDYENQKDLSEWEVSVSNIELIKFQIAADSEKMYISIPTLLENTYDITFDGFAEKFNNSVWAQMLETTLVDDVELNPWAEEETADTSVQFSEEFQTELEEKLKEMAESITIEEMETVIEVSRNGKTVQCDGIYVVAPKEDLNDIIEMIQNEMRDGTYGQEVIAMLTESGVANVEESWELITSILDARFAEDFQLVFYLDNKNNIVHMATPEVITLNDGASAGFAFDFVGEKNPTDVMEGFFKVFTPEGNNTAFDFKLENKVEDTVVNTEFELEYVVEEVGFDPEKGNFDFSYEWNSDKKEFEMEASMNTDGTYSFEFVMEGAFTDIVQSESFTLQLGTFNLTESDDIVLKVSGEMEVKPLEDEVKIPSESVDLLGMTQMDITSMLMEIMTKAENMTEALNEFSY